MCIRPALFLLMLAPGANASSIAGRIVDETGQAVPGAVVKLTKRVEYTRDPEGRPTVKEHGFARNVSASPDGSYRFDDLAGGNYQICAYGRAPSQIAGCVWDISGSIDLGPRQDVQHVTRTVFNGAVLTIRVADPRRRIMLPDTKGVVERAGRFFISVLSDAGRYEPVRWIATAGAEQVFQLGVPRHLSYRLFIDTDLVVSDAADKRVETRQPTALRIRPEGAASLAVALKVE